MPNKVCIVCGIDVSTIKRVKDPQGNYYCQVCYDAKLAAKRARSSGDPETDFQCDTCRRFYGVEDVYDENGKVICKACFAERARPALKGQFTAKPDAPAAEMVWHKAEKEPELIELAEDAPAPKAPAWHETPAAPAVPVEEVDELEEVGEDPATPTVAAMMWHVHDKGESHGPLPTDQLVQAIKEGRYSTAASVWKDGMQDWQPILQIEKLLGHAI